MAPPVTLKEVKVKRTVYSTVFDADKIKQYMIDCVDTGSSASLFQDPNITTAFYADGTTAFGNIQTALNTYGLAPTSGNKTVVETKVASGKLWLDQYADQVEVISNAPGNRTTREEAYANIQLSYLTPQKLTATSKGIPEVPVLTASNIGTGKIDVRVINGVDYNPSQTTLIVVEASTGAVITVVNGQLKIKLVNPGDVVVQAAAKKGKFTHFTDLKPNVEYLVYAYAQNGKKQVSALSVAVSVKG